MKKLQPLHSFFFLLSMFCFVSGTFAQLNLADEAVPDKLVPKELSIPSSPLFDLMGASPSLVAKSADIKNFKVDWSFRSWRLNPNIAIQSQPIWELFYNRKKLQKYQQAGRVSRMLASTDLSLGTIQNEVGDRRIGGALKLNLYKQFDPLLIKNMYQDVEQVFQEEYTQLVAKERALLKQLDTLTKPSEIAVVRGQLKDNDVQLSTFYNRKNTAIQEKAASVLADHWNAAFVDIAFGKIYTYGTDSAGGLGSLRLNRNTGNGLWINAGVGIGKRGMLTALIRNTFYEEELSFLTRDATTGEEQTQSAIADNSLITLGLSFRYGGPVYNFFIEFVREGKTVKTPIEALNDVFKLPADQQLIESSVKWDIVNPYLITLGGDWRIGRNLMLNYGVRLVFDDKFSTKQVIPIANISCMMR